MSGNVDFEEQLLLESAEQKRLSSFNANLNVDKSNIREDDDGTVYQWDERHKAWFPKVSDYYLAQYQASYGVQEKDGEFLYKDTNNDRLYIWDKKEECWKDKESGEMLSQQQPASSDQKVNEPVFDDQVQAYVWADSETGKSFKFDQTFQTWIPFTKRCDEDNDKKKKKNKNKKELSAPEIKKHRAKWFQVDAGNNTQVYVSGLPTDITLDEFSELMGKYGIIMEDPQTKKPKLKLYENPETGNYKGDGRCCYLKIESVNLAKQMLDGMSYRDGTTLYAGEATFTLKGEYNPKLKPLPSAKRKRNRKKPTGQEKYFSHTTTHSSRLLQWKPDKVKGQRFNSEKSVVIKNMFAPEDFDKDPTLILEFSKDLREECATYGLVKRVKKNSEGIATITFKEFEEADVCVSALNGRWYGGRKLQCDHWNGRDRFVIKSNIGGDNDSDSTNDASSTWKQFLEDDEEETI